MKRWLGAVARLAASVEGRVDAARYSRSDARPARVDAYVGYGTRSHVTLLGRVVRDLAPGPTVEHAGSWANLLATVRRFESDEVSRARVRVAFADTVRELVADEEGHFLERVALEHPLPDGEAWHEAIYDVVPEPGIVAGEPARGRILVPARTAALGVISDIDDTVVRTDATNLLRMARTLLFGNAHTRLPFPGVAAFYRALAAGSGGAANPLFYVSSSPWNLHDLLVEFFTLRRIPIGPLLLRDWGIEAHELLPLSHGSHKQLAIRRILAEYPTLPFLLVGDSGQEDPEIYASVVHDHPGRIRAVYIRDVTAHRPARAEAIARLAREVDAANSELLLAPDSATLARHAAAHGWIRPEALGEIEGEMEEG